jgi:hypothetical protein
MFLLSVGSLAHFYKQPNGYLLFLFNGEIG